MDGLSEHTNQVEPFQIHSINAYTNVLMEVMTETLDLDGSQVRDVLQTMYNDVSSLLRSHDVDYAQLKSALTPSSGRFEIAFVFNSAKAQSSFYGIEFSQVWLRALRTANGPRRTSISQGDIIGLPAAVIWEILNRELIRPPDAELPRLSTEQYFVVYLTNVSRAQRETLDREMRISSGAYLGYVDCSCWTPLKTSLPLPQLALRIDDKVITAEDDSGNSNLGAHPFDEFGLEVVGVPDDLYGVMLEHRIDMGVASWGSTDSAFALSALGGIRRDVASMRLEIDEHRFSYLISEEPGHGHGASIRKAGLQGFDRFSLADAIKTELSKSFLFNLRGVEGTRVEDGLRVAAPENDALMFTVQVEFSDLAGSMQRYQVSIKYEPKTHVGNVVTVFG
jgi:hypothetical protein